MKTSYLLKVLPVAVAFVVAAPLFTACTSTATRSSAGEYIDDSVITTKVKAALAGDKVVNAFAVTVETFKGVVQLSGFVDSTTQKDQAEAVARRVGGVQSVINNISVKTEAANTAN